MSKVSKKDFNLINDNYELTTQISYTNNSKIYQAYDHNKKTNVVMKIIKINSKDDEIAVKNEIRTMSFISECEFIPKLIDWAMYSDDAYCIIMEYIDSITLKEKIWTKGLWSFEEIILIFWKILKCVIHIHEHNIVHNDLKPENILFLRSGSIKIIDFGISRFADEKSKLSKLKGTPKYIAPEIIKNKKSDIRSDIYSLGVILYELLTGVSPFENFDKSKIIKLQIKNKFIKPGNINHKISKKLESIVIKAMQTDPKDRYQTTKEFQISLKKEVQNILKISLE